MAGIRVNHIVRRETDRAIATGVPRLLGRSTRERPGIAEPLCELPGNGIPALL
jgi:hypothetical protein